MIHLRYSTLLLSCILTALQTDILPLTKEVCDTIKTRTPSSPQAKTFRLKMCSFKSFSEKRPWFNSLITLKLPDGLACKSATAIRQRDTLAPERVDYVDRGLLHLLTPAQRETTRKIKISPTKKATSYPTTQIPQRPIQIYKKEERSIQATSDSWTELCWSVSMRGGSKSSTPRVTLPQVPHSSLQLLNAYLLSLLYLNVELRKHFKAHSLQVTSRHSKVSMKPKGAHPLYDDRIKY